MRLSDIGSCFGRRGNVGWEPVAAAPRAALALSLHVPVGRRWMDDPGLASFDLVAIHYGSNESFACPLCKKVGGSALAGPEAPPPAAHPYWPCNVAPARATSTRWKPSLVPRCDAPRCNANGIGPLEACNLGGVLQGLTRTAAAMLSPAASRHLRQAAQRSAAQGSRQRSIPTAFINTPHHLLPTAHCPPTGV